ncbi:MAG TPA: hypothetical protein PKI46_00960 [Bacteroidales bacterium]|nr:hypothetical protein [Bacteroidales bacterium]
MYLKEIEQIQDDIESKLNYLGDSCSENDGEYRYEIMALVHKLTNEILRLRNDK